MIPLQKTLKVIPINQIENMNAAKFLVFLISIDFVLFLKKKIDSNELIITIIGV